MPSVAYRWTLTDVADEVTVEDDTKIRVDRTRGLRLRGTWDGVQGGRQYDTTANGWYADFPTTTIGAVVGLKAFDAVTARHSDRLSPYPTATEATADSTTVLWQVLLNGVPWWWSGATWEVASGNTEANALVDVQTNIAHQSLLDGLLDADGKIGFSAVLKTTSAEWTPEVQRVDLLVDIDPAVSGLDDAIVRSLGGELEALTIPGEWQDVAPAGGLALIDLSQDTIRREFPYQYSSIRGVYDLTADPGRKVDLYSGGFSPVVTDINGRPWTTGGISLDTPIPATNTYVVEFEHTARVSVQTHRDFAGADGYELSDVLEIQIRDPEIEATVVLPDIEVLEQRTDPGTGINDGYIVSNTRLSTVGMILAARSEIGQDGARMAQAIRTWIGHGRTVTSLATGLPMTLVLRDPGVPVSQGDGRSQRHDLGVGLYSVREPGTAAGVKVVRTVQLTGSPVPLR